MYPAKWFFRQARGGADDRSRDPPRRRRGPLHRDAGLRPEGSDRRASTSSINPLVNWIWFGFGVMALGTGHRAAAGTGLQLRGGQAAGRRPHHDHGAAVRAARCCSRRVAARPARRDGTDTCRSLLASRSNASMQQNLICMCGTCGRQLLSRVSVQPGSRDAGRTGGARGRRPHEASRSSISTSRSTAARSRWRSRSTRASTASRGRCRTCSVRRRLLVRGSVAVRWTRRGATSSDAAAQVRDTRTPVDRRPRKPPGR